VASLRLFVPLIQVIGNLTTRCADIGISSSLDCCVSISLLLISLLVLSTGHFVIFVSLFLLYVYVSRYHTCVRGIVCLVFTCVT
jgi:hypothetical protein